MSEPDRRRLTRALEAILFAAPEPAPRERLRLALAVDDEMLDALLIGLTEALADRGLWVQRHGDLVQLVTAPDLAADVERFLGAPAPQRLTHAALEALAVVAYQQPVTRSRIEAVRGVDSGGVVTTLLARGLIDEVGRLTTPGHPVQYGTTPEFLRLFGLASLDEMPALAAADGTPLAEMWESRARRRATSGGPRPDVVGAEQ